MFLASLLYPYQQNWCLCISLINKYKKFIFGNKTVLHVLVFCLSIACDDAERMPLNVTA